MSNTFIDISIDHEKCISEYTCQLMHDISRNKDQDGDKDFRTKDIPLVGYTDKVRTDMNDIKNSVETINNDRVAAYKTVAMNNNPVGMSLPKTDYEDDEYIAKYYKDLRTVILDKFQEAATTNPMTGEKVGTGGQGWIVFIDTLATPEERAANYKIPKFDNVYTMFVKERKPSSRVDKNQVTCALETIMNFSKDMETLISEADEYSDDRSKRVYLHNNKTVETFEEAVESLAEYAFIAEEDFIMAQSLEARKHKLLEGVKNAHEVLTALAAHNPRDIKESALCRDICLAGIRSKLDDAISNPASFIETNESLQESDINKSIDLFRKSTMSNNARTLEKYKESALQSNCAGLYMNDWKTPLDTDTPIKQSIAIFLNVFSKDSIKSDSPDRLKNTYESLKIADKIISSKKTSGNMEKISSPAVKKAIGILPFIDRKSTDPVTWACNIEDKHKVTKDDVANAVEFLEKDINDLISSLENDAASDSSAMDNYNAVISVPTSKVSKKDAFIMDIDKLIKKIVANLNYEKYNAKLARIRALNAQSTKVLVSASRVVSSETIAEENAKLKSFFECVSELDKSLNEIIYGKSNG